MNVSDRKLLDWDRHRGTCYSQHTLPDILRSTGALVLTAGLSLQSIDGKIYPINILLTVTVIIIIITQGGREGREGHHVISPTQHYWSYNIAVQQTQHLLNTSQ